MAIRKDYIVRQFEEFGKFIALVFGLKKDGKWNELEKLINENATKFTGIEIENIEQMKEESFLSLLSEEKLSDEQLKMLGDMLYEKGLAYEAQVKPEDSHGALNKAKLIYEHLTQNALQSDFSLDVHFKIRTITQILGNQ